MLIFELLDQYEGICRRAFFGCATKLNKTFKTNIIEILILIMCIPQKINFLQLGRYGRRSKQRYAIAIDPSYFINIFFDLSGIDPYKTLNAKLVNELFGLATDAV